MSTDINISIGGNNLTDKVKAQQRAARLARITGERLDRQTQEDATRATADSPSTARPTLLGAALLPATPSTARPARFRLPDPAATRAFGGVGHIAEAYTALRENNAWQIDWILYPGKRTTQQDASFTATRATGEQNSTEDMFVEGAYVPYRPTGTIKETNRAVYIDGAVVITSATLNILVSTTTTSRSYLRSGYIVLPVGNKNAIILRMFRVYNDASYTVNSILSSIDYTLEQEGTLPEDVAAFVAANPVLTYSADYLNTSETVASNPFGFSIEGQAFLVEVGDDILVGSENANSRSFIWDNLNTPSEFEASINPEIITENKAYICSENSIKEITLKGALLNVVEELNPTTLLPTDDINGTQFNTFSNIFSDTESLRSVLGRAREGFLSGPYAPEPSPPAVQALTSPTIFKRIYDYMAIKNMPPFVALEEILAYTNATKTIRTDTSKGYYATNNFADSLHYQQINPNDSSVRDNFFVLRILDNAIPLPDDVTGTNVATSERTIYAAWDWGDAAYCRRMCLALGFTPEDLQP